MFSDISAKPCSVLTEYCAAGQFVSQTESAIERRKSIDRFTLIYETDGNADIFIGTRHYVLSPDSYIILPALCERSISVPDGASYFWCDFYIRGDYGINTSDVLTFGENSDFSIPLFSRVRQCEKIRLLFDQLIDASLSPSPFSKAICGNFLEIIMRELAFGCLLSENASSLSQEKAVLNIIEWIRLNAPDIKNVGEVADHFGYSSQYLTTLVKKISSKSLTDHISESKVELAKGLLADTDLEIAEIAHSCGFSDEKYFFRVFKKICGITPRAYRTNKNTASD